ncbi:MAG: DUF4389 domain-containing protein [SAR202 cluster bacterium]|nr:DUF4389 domain-containing protein [SAR202 cluster bacterium]
MVTLEPPAASSPPSPSYPGIRLDVAYPEKLSRGTLLLKTFLGWIYIWIPHGIVLYILGILARLAIFVSFFVILFTKKYPKGLFDFVVGVQSWNLRVQTHASLLLNDKYPPFSLSAQDYPTRLEVDNPPVLSRLFVVLKLLFGWLYVGIPHGVILFFYLIGVVFVTIFAWFHILFTGKYPRSVFNFVIGYLRWQERVTAYLSLQRDEYPPFHGRP